MKTSTLFLPAAIFLSVTSCGSKFYGRDGQLTADIHGDFTYQRTKDGAETITLKHSPVITAAGKAASLGIGAAGTAASAALLAK